MNKTPPQSTMPTDRESMSSAHVIHPINLPELCIETDTIGLGGPTQNWVTSNILIEYNW